LAAIYPYKIKLLSANHLCPEHLVLVKQFVDDLLQASDEESAPPAGSLRALNPF
jgi:hypothetical protein